MSLSDSGSSDEQESHEVILETQTDLGDLEAEEFTDLNQIVIDKKYKEMKERHQQRSCCSEGFLCRLFRTYDNHFLLSLGLQYFNNGMKVMLTLAFLDIFKTQFELEPAETQFLMSVMVLPWTPKLFYGIISDTFPICKSRKKSYIILMGFVQGICAISIPFLPVKNEILITALGTGIALSGAVMDVVVDGLMVCQARIDPENGSEELQAYSWALVGLGGIVGGVVGGELTNIGQGQIVFFVMGALGFLVALSGCLMNRNLESGSEKVISMSLCQRTKLNLVEIKNGFAIRELYRSVIFFMLLGAVIPSFADYFYYYQMDVTGFTKFDYAMFGVIGYVCLFAGTLAYNWFLKNKEIRCMMVIACLVNLVGAVGSLLFVRNIMFGMDPYWFMIVSSSVADVLFNAFVQLPGMVLFAKLIPSNIESSMFALLTGLMNFSNLFAAKMLGNYINTFINVTEDNLEDLWKLYVIQIGCCLIPGLFICLLPNRMQVEQVQKALEFKEKQDKVSEEQAEQDLMRLDPNVALRLGIAKSMSFQVSSQTNLEDDNDDIEFSIAEEEAAAARDPMRKLLNASQKLASD